MKSIIIGTAGHVDHGKTVLVKALTGIDADRLEEEKRRGITIDLGFAHMDLPVPNGEVLRLGFVDVPGHERFVRNMLAGIGGIDLVLLIIAADESIKPQTREHFDILQLLGVPRGITVLTKSDAVDPDTLEVVRMEVEEFLRGTSLEAPRSPIIAVSALTGAGLNELKQAIAAAAGQVSARDSEALPRLPIDRVFSMKGFGTVVTGTLISGTIWAEQELEVFSTAKRVRVRGVQVHGTVSNAASAGQRTALNVSGANKEDLSRGMVLAPPATFLATRRADVRLKLLKSAPHPLKDRTRVHFHTHSSESVAEVMLAEKQAMPGWEGFVRLKLSEPLLLLPGDHFIIRQFSPLITIGGGTVLDALPLSRKRVVSDLQILATGHPSEILSARIARRNHDGASLAQLVAETGWTSKVIQTHLAEAIKNGIVLRIGDTFLSVSAWKELEVRIVAALNEFHRANPLVEGMSREQLRAASGASEGIFNALTQALVRERKVELAGDIVRLPGRGVVLKDEESESKKKIEQAFATAGLKVPALNDVLAGLKIDRSRAQKIVTLLLRDRTLIKVSDDLVFHQQALQSLRVQLAQQKSRSPRIDVATFKEMTGITRKYAIPLLEYLDRERVTKRVGDAREIL